MINLAYGAKIRTNDLLIISLLTLPLDHYGIKLAASL